MNMQDKPYIQMTESDWETLLLEVEHVAFNIDIFYKIHGEKQDDRNLRKLTKAADKLFKDLRSYVEERRYD